MQVRLALVLVLQCLWPASGRTARQGVINFDDLFAAYCAGDHQAVSRSLSSRQAFDRLRPKVPTAAKRWIGQKPSAWSRQRPAFLLEIAILAASYSHRDMMAALDAGHTLVMERPAPLFGNPAEDAFETLWHRLAVAVLQLKMMPLAEHAYLDTLERRYLTGPAGTNLQQPLDPRFVLDRVIADEQLFWLADIEGGESSTRLTVAVRPGDESKQARLLTKAIASADEAAALPEVANEARIRGAALRMRTGRFNAALDSIRRVALTEADRVLQYWAALLEARALHELNRLPEAERVYREIATTWPEATAPATGLALVLFEMNRRDDAMAVVTAVRTTPAGAEPWSSYMFADARFIIRWREVMRGMLQ